MTKRGQCQSSWRIQTMPSVLANYYIHMYCGREGSDLAKKTLGILIWISLAEINQLQKNAERYIQWLFECIFSLIVLIIFRIPIGRARPYRPGQLHRGGGYKYSWEAKAKFLPSSPLPPPPLLPLSTLFYVEQLLHLLTCIHCQKCLFFPFHLTANDGSYEEFGFAPMYKVYIHM